MNTCHDNPQKSSTAKISKHIPFGYSLYTHCSFDTTKNKFDYYRGKNCLKNFCLDLREHATKIIDYEKKDMTALTNKKTKIHRKQKVCYICKKDLTLMIKKYYKVIVIHYHSHSILSFSLHRKI